MDERTRGFVRRQPADDILSRSLVGQHPLMRALRESVKRHARGSLPVLIEGEPGTGKERVARALHDVSNRFTRPFIANSLAASAPSLLESELFGHERGGFTGASDQRVGCMERAEDGTVFLDEILDAPIHCQAKLLRAIDPGEFCRVGGNEVLRLRARIVSATNASPEALLRSGHVREDFLGRIGAIRVRVPALRERLSDLSDLSRSILEEDTEKTDRPARFVTKAGIRLLEQQPWPSNVRDLRNVLLQCASWVEVEAIDSPDIEEALRNRARVTPVKEEALSEADQIRKVLRQERGVVTRTRRRLGLSHSTIYERFEKYGIDPSKFRAGQDMSG